MEKEKKNCSWIESSLPIMGMVLAVTGLAINMIVSKIAMSNGTSFFIISVYSNALASLILFPSAFLFNSSNRPPLNFPILCKIFLLACFGCIADIGSYAGIKHSSPTLGTELLNLVPGFTFILAVIFRMEVLNLRRSSDISKCLGTITLIAGASIVTFYKGPEILNKTHTLNPHELLLASKQNWVLGGSLLAFAGFSTAAWSIIQTSILKVYPSEMAIMALYCFFVTTQSTIVALIAEKDSNAWKLQAEMGLVAVVYAGIINITFRLYMMTWCLSRKGPLFVSLFNPLTIVVSVVIGVICFQEVLYLGSVVGALIIVIGFYAVIWGKAKAIKMDNNSEVSNTNVESTSHEVPLLQDKVDQQV